MTTEGLKDITEHFHPCKLPWTRDDRAGIIIHRCQEMRSRTHYIHGTDCRLFQNVDVQEPRHNIDHYLVLECLRGMTQREHQCYLGACTQLPLYPHKRPFHKDSLFASLWKAVPKKPARECSHASWISEETWKVIYVRVYLWRSPDRDQCHLRDIGRSVRSLLDGDRRRQVTEAGTAVDTLLKPEPPLIKEAWYWMQD